MNPLSHLCTFCVIAYLSVGLGFAIRGWESFSEHKFGDGVSFVLFWIGWAPISLSWLGWKLGGKIERKGGL